MENQRVRPKQSPIAVMAEVIVCVTFLAFVAWFLITGATGH